MMAYMNVSRSETASVTQLPQHSSKTTVPVQRQKSDLSMPAKHEKLRRLGEAVTDVFCAGAEAIVDTWGTQGMSKRVHGITETVHTSSDGLFQVSLGPSRRVFTSDADNPSMPQAPYARLQALSLEQQTKIDEQISMIEKLRISVSDGEVELVQQREQAALLQQELSGSQQENATLREKTETLTADLEAAREKAEKLAAELAAARGQTKESEAKPTLKPRIAPPRRQTSTSPWGMLAATFLSQPSTPSA